VTSSPASVTAAQEALSETDAVGVVRFTVGGDDLVGDAGNNLFKAVVGQNALGQQVNTLGSGDFADGRGGIDTLEAKVTTGVFAGSTGLGSVTMPIEPELKSIEIVKLDATIAGVGSDENQFFGARADQVFVSAESMTDVAQLWSYRSEADLTIMQATTKGLDQLSDMTIGMAYTGNADTNWGESDMYVYFDQDYLVPEATRTDPVVDFLAMNEDAYDRAGVLGLNPQDFALDGVFFRELNFRLNGETFDLKQFFNEDANGTGAEIRSYTEFLAAVQDALVELKAANPTNAALQSVTASFGQTFRTDVDPVTLVQREGVGIRLTVDGLTNGTSNILSVLSTDLEVARAANASVPNNNRYEIASASVPTTGSKLGINVALEKVGLAGDGGELVIGSMNKHTDNEWDDVNTVVDGTTSGINEFYTTVYGNNTKSSSLSGLHSTNNNLRVVTVTTDAAQTGTFANLTIGNSNTNMGGFLGYENALKDVQTFDASAFKGDLTLYAALTDEVTDKYLNLKDEAPDAPGADNLNFEYTGGTGDDDINLTISADNGSASGAATREDFLMNATIDGGDGDDMITLALINANNPFRDDDADGLAYGIDNFSALSPSSPQSGYANWYDNQKLNSNLRIDGGNGNDTIWTPGSGDVIIDGGAGNDTVYADNTGDKAVWAFNYEGGGAVSRRDLNNLQSDANDSYNLFKASVEVSFLGFEGTAAIVDTRGVATDLDINQAIKKAINSDPELSKLLVATDGPANTLVVTSLIDGERVDSDLVVTLVSPSVSAITAGDASQLSGWYSAPGLTPAAAKALIDAQVAIFNSNTDGVYNMDFARFGGDLIGSDSDHTSDNTITGDLGNDVLVLGTGSHSNDTVVYKGFGNGTDTIVNFSDAGVSVTDVNTALVSITQQGSAGTPAGTAVAETFTLTLTGTAAAAPGTITFDDVYFGVGAANITPTAGDSASVIATAVAAQINAGGVWTANASGGVVTATQVVAAAVVDVAVSNAGPTPIQYDGSGVGMTTAVTTQSAPGAAVVPAATEAFTVTFGNATQAGTYSFGGANVSVLNGESGANIAAAFASAAVTGWTATHVADTNVVTFTSTTASTNVADVTDASFVGANVEVETLGLTDGFDVLDFSAYNAQGVFVDGVLVAGTAPTALGQTYITLVESAQDGIYTMTQLTEAGALGTAGDTTVGIIGVADFGVEQVFVAQNFVI
jgi:hypothetical protein